MFFFFLVMLSNFFIILIFKENIRVKLAAAIPTGAPTTLTEEIIQTPPLVALKTVQHFKSATFYLIFYCMFFFG